MMLWSDTVAVMVKMNPPIGTPWNQFVDKYGKYGPREERRTPGTYFIAAFGSPLATTICMGPL